LIEVLVVSKAGNKFHKSPQRESFEQELTEIPKKVVLVPDIGSIGRVFRRM
jgi:hypothetical protein